MPLPARRSNSPGMLPIKQKENSPKLHSKNIPNGRSSSLPTSYPRRKPSPLAPAMQKREKTPIASSGSNTRSPLRALPNISKAVEVAETNPIRSIKSVSHLKRTPSLDPPKTRSTAQYSSPSTAEAVFRRNATSPITTSNRTCSRTLRSSKDGKTPRSSAEKDFSTINSGIKSNGSKKHCGVESGSTTNNPRSKSSGIANRRAKNDTENQKGNSVSQPGPKCREIRGNSTGRKTQILSPRLKKVESNSLDVGFPSKIVESKTVQRFGEKRGDSAPSVYNVKTNNGRLGQDLETLKASPAFNGYGILAGELTPAHSNGTKAVTVTNGGSDFTPSLNSLKKAEFQYTPDQKTQVTPPVKPSISPEIHSQDGNQDLKQCFGAGHIMAPVWGKVRDRRKCKPRGILIAGDAKPLPLEEGLQHSLVFEPATASVKWVSSQAANSLSSPSNLQPTASQLSPMSVPSSASPDSVPATLKGFKGFSPTGTPSSKFSSNSATPESVLCKGTVPPKIGYKNFHSGTPSKFTDDHDFAGRLKKAYLSSRVLPLSGSSQKSSKVTSKHCSFADSAASSSFRYNLSDPTYSTIPLNLSPDVENFCLSPCRGRASNTDDCTISSNSQRNIGFIPESKGLHLRSPSEANVVKEISRAHVKPNTIEVQNHNHYDRSRHFPTAEMLYNWEDSSAYPGFKLDPSSNAYLFSDTEKNGLKIDADGSRTNKQFSPMASEPLASRQYGLLQFNFEMGSSYDKLNKEDQITECIGQKEGNACLEDSNAAFGSIEYINKSSDFNNSLVKSRISSSSMVVEQCEVAESKRKSEDIDWTFWCNNQLYEEKE